MFERTQDNKVVSNAVYRRIQIDDHTTLSVAVADGNIYFSLKELMRYIGMSENAWRSYFAGSSLKRMAKTMIGNQSDLVFDVMCNNGKKMRWSVDKETAIALMSIQFQKQGANEKSKVVVDVLNKIVVEDARTSGNRADRCKVGVWSLAYYRCSACLAENASTTKYCPNCGAMMMK